MRFQTATSPTDTEKVFALFRSAQTVTNTITSANFGRGNPAILATHSASNDGYSITHLDTTVGAGNLFVGIVADYPDTSANKTGISRGEDAVWVQVYGFNPTATILKASTAAVGAGALLIPSTAAALIAATSTPEAGTGGLVVLAQALGTASSTATTTAKVFIRAM